MAYGDNRIQVATDDLSTLTDFATAEGDYGDFQTVPGGHIEPDTVFEIAGARYTAATLHDDQYCTGTVQAMAVTNGDLRVGVRCQSGTDESGYHGLNTESDNTFKILELNSSFGDTELASTGTGHVDLDVGDTHTIEAEGTTLRYGDDIGGSDSERLNTTDNTISDGDAFLGAFSASSNDDSQYTGFECGDIAQAGSFVIPDAVHLMQTDWDLDARARGAFAGAGEAQPATRNTKVNGSLPLTGSNATGFVNTQGSSATGPLRGVYWEFLASGGYDVSSDTKVCIMVYQYNAPNRVQCATKANDGLVFRSGTGSGSPPTNYRTWQIGGNDTVAGQDRKYPLAVVIDLNDTSNDATVGTYDNTDVQCFGFGTVRFNISGSSTLQYFFARTFVFDTTKGATNIPRFIGADTDWDETINAVGTAYNTKITNDWITREGSVFSYASPVQIGDNDAVTTFNDNGATVFWPNSNSANDPRVRVTDQAFRVYLNLRNSPADSATFSGFYDAGDSNPDWDFDQDDDAVVTFNGPTFRNTGQFDVGSSVSGSATFDNCGVVWFNDNGVDLDGSTFRNPNGDHLVRLAA